MALSPIDLLTIQDQEWRRKKFERVHKNAKGQQKLLADAYMELVRKNQT